MGVVQSVRSEIQDLRLMVMKEVLLDALRLDRAVAVAEDEDRDVLLLTAGDSTVRITAVSGRLYVEKLV